MAEETPTGLSRRDLIKRGAIIGGVAWTAPVVQSLANPAFASSPPPPGECTEKFRFKIDYGDKYFDTPSSPTNGNLDCPPDGWLDVDGTVGDNGSIPGVVGKIMVEWDYNGSDKCALITVPAGVILLDGDAKAGSSKGGTLECADAEPVQATGNQYVVCLSRRSISHIKGIVCIVE